MDRIKAAYPSPTDNRVANFNAGPGALPLRVLQKAQEELLNFNGKAGK
jgi:phosphoserine aminotransferase